MRKNNDILKDEMILMGLVISFFALGIINYFYPISSSKIFACSVATLLISLSEICSARINFWEVYGEHAIMQEEKIHETNLALGHTTKDFDQNAEIDRATESIDKCRSTFEKKVRIEKITANTLFVLAIVLLIVGITVDILPITEADANSWALISVSIVFGAFLYSKINKRRINDIKNNINDLDSVIERLQ